MSTRNQKTSVELVPFQKENLATNQQQIPVPYLAGERVVAGRWITPTLDVRTKKTDATGKKG
jgi:hypothetical protein